MSFTYDGTLDTNLEKVRLELGDVDSSAALFQDAEINYFLAEEGDNVLEAAARACDALARKFGRAYDFETDGQAFKRGQMAKAYMQLASELRDRAASGLTTLATTRIDGYSDDIDYSETRATSRWGRVRAGWWDPDLPH